MAAFADLNINYIDDKKQLRDIIETAAHLGYSTVAINHLIDLQPKKQEIRKPASVDELFRQLPVVQGKSRPIKVLNRLTLGVSDASHFRPYADLKYYDLVAVVPKTEKMFHAACMTFDVDIICITVTEKQPFFFKRPPVNGAIDRGVFFEITYTPAIKDSTMRRYTISNALSLMQTCKGKNVIISSGAEKPLDLRGPYDISNLGLVFGLSEGDAKAAVSTNCRAALLHAETRKTALGIIHTIKKTQTVEEDQDQEAPASKRAKTKHV